MSHSLPPTTQLLTAEDLCHYPDDGAHKYELVEGRLFVSEPPGVEHGSIALNVGAALQAFVEPRRLGLVTMEVGCVLRRGPDTVRGPDVTFVRFERIPASDQREKFFEGAPDLAVEVISPSERAGEVARKVASYLAAGTQLVWAVYPRKRLVVVHTPGGDKRLLREPEALAGGDLLPGFVLPVRKVFAGPWG